MVNCLKGDFIYLLNIKIPKPYLYHVPKTVMRTEPWAHCIVAFLICTPTQAFGCQKTNGFSSDTHRYIIIRFAVALTLKKAGT